MAAPSSHLQQTLHVSSMKPSSSSPSSPTALSSMKLKSLIHTLILSHVCRFARALSRAKSILVQILKEHHHLTHYLVHHPRSPRRRNKNLDKIFFGSFRLHYNWCSSSHVLPVPAPILERLPTSRHFYDEDSASAMWRSAGLSAREPRQLSGYLQWLEEKEERDATSDGGCPPPEINEIDQLADLFIAGFHEKFRLEKQESYRRFQEMLARSM